jgi:hypothetical protein
MKLLVINEYQILMCCFNISLSLDSLYKLEEIENVITGYTDIHIPRNFHGNSDLKLVTRLMPTKIKSFNILETDQYITQLRLS